VVALLPGSDPRLRSQYVVIGAPNDHLAPFGRADHDSLRIVNLVTRPLGAASIPLRPSPEEARVIAFKLDSVRRLRPPRVDSIYNGADDGGSGAVAALEIAEAMARGDLKPKRSILFIWFAGEESGLRGAGYFVDHSTVPRDSMVAEINLNSMGRGELDDVTGVTASNQFQHGGSRYVAVIGSRFQSSELGDLVTAANVESRPGLDLDYLLDGSTTPVSLFCRSDQAQFARVGIPVVYLTTGGNADFHQVTDEPQYIQYDHLARITRLAQATALKVANLGHRLAVDQPNPDPRTLCRQ
jgi:Zn-dependent M28 family amino/carboxypeptidase